MRPDLPSRARVVVIGGGVIGTSIAYHLAREGMTEVLLLERDRLTSGTTWHAAGLMTTFGSLSQTATELRLYSRELYARLEAETGQSTGFRPIGLIEAAADATRLEEYRRVATFQRRLGLEVHEITPAEMAEKFPFARTDDLLAGFWVPGDGRVNPVDLTMALARGARNAGVRLVEGVAVDRVLTRESGGLPSVTGVRTASGQVIECETVVNCAGMWARELAARNGVVVPNQAAEHYYLITDTIDGLTGEHPVFEDPAAHGYYREEGGGMMVGLFEPVAAAWRVDGIPADASFTTLQPDWDRMTPFLQTAMERVPVTLDAGVRTFFCGPESFTPDLRPAVGEAPGLRGYFVCAGLNSVGVLSAGGMGRIVAHWVATGRPDVDVTAFHVDRFHDWQLDPRYREQRTAEILGTVYAAHPPGTELASGRGMREHPLLDRLVAAGAVLRDVGGFESAAFYGGGALTAGFGPQPWWPQWEAEHRAVREAVGVIDLSFMARFTLTGPDAAAVLERLSTARVAARPGRVTYTQWLDEQGGIQADLTVTALPDGTGFHVVASDTAHGHVRALLTAACAGRAVALDDVTGRWAILAVQGPGSRDLLAGLAPEADWSPAGFRFRDVREVDLAGQSVLAQRITYVGELGWELHVPGAAAGAVWDAVLGAGARPVGLSALASLRLEKGYRDYGHDIDNTDSLLGVGLDWTCASDQPGGFVGDAAVAAQRAALGSGEPAGRLVSILVPDPAAQLVHGEIVLRDGIPVGDVRAGSYGWTVGGSVGLAFVEHTPGVDLAWLTSGEWSVDVAGRRVPAVVSLAPPYDPEGARPRM